MVQDTHDVLFTINVVVLTGQLVHVPAPAPLNVPTGHGEHEDDADDENVPLGHTWHVPLVTLYIPEEQAAQSLAPL